MKRLVVVFGLLTFAPVALAGEAPKKMPAKANGDAAMRALLLFPSPSELAMALKAAGFQVAPIPKLDAQIGAPVWSQLPALQKELQLGSMIGFLAFAAVVGDMHSLTRCLDQLLGGAEALGVDKKSPSSVALAQLRDRAKKGQISDAQMLAGLDDARRKVLREISGKVEAREFSFVLGAAWLRGSALLASQVKSDADAAKVGEFVMRPELLAFISKIPAPSSAQAQKPAASAERLLALAKKSEQKDAKITVSQSDLTEFVSFANSLLKEVR